MDGVLEALVRLLPFAIGVLWVLRSLRKVRPKDKKRAASASPRQGQESSAARQGQGGRAAGQGNIASRSEVSPNPARRQGSNSLAAGQGKAAGQNARERIMNALSQMEGMLENSDREASEAYPAQSPDSPWAPRVAVASEPQASPELHVSSEPQALSEPQEFWGASVPLTQPARAPVSEKTVIPRGAGAHHAAMQPAAVHQTEAKPAAEPSENLRADGSEEPSSASRLFENLSRLSPVAQGMVWSVILDKPVCLKD